jgi:hypothetical protein
LCPGELVTAKIDFKQELECYRARRHSPQVTDVPDLQYLMIDGHGDPNTPVYMDAVSALYPVAYKLKFASKKDLGRDYVVMPLEGLWWAHDMDTFTTVRDKTQWHWTLMIMVPDWITAEMLTDAVEQVGMKDRPMRLDDFRLEVRRRDAVSRLFTLGPTTMRPNCCGTCTRSSSPVRVSRWSESTTRSTSAIRGEWSPRSCARSCGSP